MQCNYLLALELKKNEQLAKGVYIFVFFLRLLNDFSTFTIKKKGKNPGVILSFHVDFLVKFWDNKECFGHFTLIK